jgi:hypothetical protein
MNEMEWLLTWKQRAFQIAPQRAHQNGHDGNKVERLQDDGEVHKVQRHSEAKQGSGAWNRPRRKRKNPRPSKYLSCCPVTVRSR